MYFGTGDSNVMDVQTARPYRLPLLDESKDNLNLTAELLVLYTTHCLLSVLLESLHIGGARVRIET